MKAKEKFLTNMYLSLKSEKETSTQHLNLCRHDLKQEPRIMFSQLAIFLEQNYIHLTILAIIKFHIFRLLLQFYFLTACVQLLTI